MNTDQTQPSFSTDAPSGNGRDVTSPGIAFLHQVRDVLADTLLDAIRLVAVLGLFWFIAQIIEFLTAEDRERALEFVHYWGSVTVLAGYILLTIVRVGFEIVESLKNRLEGLGQR